MNAKEKNFVKTVWKYYERHGRRSLPWRKTKNPYRILVSEVMLQQTQVKRVVLMYPQFLRLFPTVKSLAKASLGDVLRAWQGLGYNRRARMLHECAKQIVHAYGGSIPRTHHELMSLPGIGHYTAGAILAFAYNIPTSILETNIRSALIHHFYTDATDITDQACFQLTGNMLDRRNPREWYYALMDYGAYIKKEFGNPNSKSKQYKKQSTFNGSDRQIRGAILRALTAREESRQSLHKTLSVFDPQRIDEQLVALEKEGLVQKRKRVYTLPR